MWHSEAPQVGVHTSSECQGSKEVEWVQHVVPQVASKWRFEPGAQGIVPHSVRALSEVRLSEQNGRRQYRHQVNVSLFVVHKGRSDTWDRIKIAELGIERMKGEVSEENRVV